jgi:hypothetical protein
MNRSYARSAVRVTSVPYATRLPYLSYTVAVMVEVELPSATMFSGSTTRAIDADAAGLNCTIVPFTALVIGFSSASLAWIVIVAVPDAVEVRVAVA